MGTIYSNSATGRAVTPPLQKHRTWRHPLALFRGIVDILSLWEDRSRQRRALARLNTDQLKDIGVNHQEAIREAAKPFWRD